MRAAVFGFTLAAFLAGAGQSRADLIFDLDLDLSAGMGGSSHADAFILRLELYKDEGNRYRQVEAIIQPDMVGQMVFVDQSDPGFSGFVSRC